jgi:hypothetical protein
MKMRWLACLLPATLVAGCASSVPEDYANEKPVFDLARYFDGTVDGWGMFQDRSGKAVKRFYVRIDGKWSGDTGTLDESFEWSDGTKSTRVWTLKRQAPGRFTGTAHDVVGTASAIGAGNAMQWRYSMKLPVNDKEYEVDFDDWMYLIDEQTMLNRSSVTKWGFRVGEVTLAFRKRAP